MKRININVLQVGDIVLTTSTQKVSAIIRSATNSDISHAMICVAYGSVMDSTDEGVQARNIQKMLYADEITIYILRTKDPLPPNALKSVIEYARGSAGTSYSMLEASAVVAPIRPEYGSAKQFCSRLVARAFANAGILLVENPDFCSPEELKNSKLLGIVEPSWIHVSNEEEAEILAESDSTIGMREVTNNLLSRVRAIENRVESLNDIDELLIKRPDLDRQISEALKKSGYLDHWKIEVDRFPWRYDQDLILKLYNELPDKKAIIEYCLLTIQDHTKGTFSHWERNAKGYCDMYSHYHLEWFQLQMGLYSTLIRLLTRRVKLAEFILKLYGE